MLAGCRRGQGAEFETTGKQINLSVRARLEPGSAILLGLPRNRTVKPSGCHKVVSFVYSRMNLYSCLQVLLCTHTLYTQRHGYLRAEQSGRILSETQ